VVTAAQAEARLVDPDPEIGLDGELRLAGDLQRPQIAFLRLTLAFAAAELRLIATAQIADATRIRAKSGLKQLGRTSALWAMNRARQRPMIGRVALELVMASGPSSTLIAGAAAVR